MPLAEAADPAVRRLLWVGVALLGVVAFGIAGYMILEDWSFDDALFMTITTMTTVGFREVRPLDAGGRIFTLTLVVLGVGVALLGVTLAASLIAEAEIGGATRKIGRASCRERVYPTV